MVSTLHIALIIAFVKHNLFSGLNFALDSCSLVYLQKLPPCIGAH